MSNIEQARKLTSGINNMRGVLSLLAKMPRNEHTKSLRKTLKLSISQTRAVLMS